MIEQFSCSNFRNVKADKLKFGRINLLIGPNNAGKSNFIRALSFAANMVNNARKDSSGFLSEVQRNGTASLLCRSSDSKAVNLTWRINLNNQTVDYTLVFRLGESLDDCYIVSEAVDSTEIIGGREHPFNYFRFHDGRPGYGMFSTAQRRGKKNHRVHVPAEQTESGLLQFDNLVIRNHNLSGTPYVSETIFSMLQDMNSYFSKFYSYMSSKFNFEKIRQLQDPHIDGSFLMKDGSNFLNVYRRACKADPDFEDRFFYKMQNMISDLTKIEILEALDKIGMRVYMGRVGYMLSEVSDGTIEALVLALLTSMPTDTAPTLLAIDEPEINLHPAWQAVLAKWLQNSGNFKQCFISTHSSDFLDSFTEGFKEGLVNIFAWDKTAAGSFKAVDTDRVNGELKNGWLLGDLYRVNDPAIVGWPW